MFQWPSYGLPIAPQRRLGRFKVEIAVRVLVGILISAIYACLLCLNNDHPSVLLDQPSILAQGEGRWSIISGCIVMPAFLYLLSVG